MERRTASGRPPTGQPLPHRNRRRKAFLRALALGATLRDAAAGAGLKRSTLYAWRRDGPRFRAAWDRAAALGREMHTARWESDMLARALEALDEPIVHDGKVVGTRRRLAERQLMLALRWLRAKRAEAAPPPAHEPATYIPKPGGRVTRVGNIDVVIVPLGNHGGGRGAPRLSETRRCTGRE